MPAVNERACTILGEFKANDTRSGKLGTLFFASLASGHPKYACLCHRFFSSPRYDSPDAEQRWAMPLPGKHRYVVSLKQSKRVWEEFGWDLLPALER